MLLEGQNSEHALQTPYLAEADASTTSTTNDPRAELEIVQAQVTLVSQHLKLLLDKTHSLKTQVNDMYSPIIHLLPPEIIAEIFQSCIPAFDMDDVDSNSSIPLLLGAVCNSWRRIAWSSPMLWSALSLRLHSSNISTQITLLGEWLARTGDLPLSIHLISEEEIHWSAPSTPGTAIEVIRKYASRWRDLDLRLPTSCYKYLPGSDEDLPLLRSLNLNPPGGQGERRHKVDMSNSAKIQHLSLSCVYLISMKFQWAHVTQMRLEAFYVDECLVALRESPQLETCSLHNIIGGDDGHAVPEAPLTLPALRSLSIENEKDTHVALLLNTIVMPNAQHFSYSGRSLVHLNSLCTLIERSPSLETLTIGQITISHEDAYLELLRVMKVVKKFVFTTRSWDTTHSPLNDDFLRMFNPKLVAPGSECLLPKLETLEYRGPQSFSWPVFLETAESRINGGNAVSTSSLHDATSNEEPVVCETDSAPCAQHGENAKQKEGSASEGSSAELSQRASIANWQSVRLNLTHRHLDTPTLPDVEGDLHRLFALAPKVSVHLTSIDLENKEVARPLSLST